MNLLIINVLIYFKNFKYFKDYNFVDHFDVNTDSDFKIWTFDTKLKFERSKLLITRYFIR